MQHRVTLLFILWAAISNAQHRVPLHGKVSVGGRPYGNVNVSNLSDRVVRKSVTRTNDIDGAFIINSRAGDTLVFSSADLLKKTVFVTPGDAASELHVEMETAVMSLEDVVITDSKKYTALSMGIIQKEIKTRTPAERRLYTAGDFKPIHLLGLLGGSLEVDPILNAINGKTKRLKKEIIVEKKVTNVEYLRDNYTGYMAVALKVPEDEIPGFIYYIVEQPEVQQIFDSKNDELTKFRLSELYSKYLQEVKE